MKTHLIAIAIGPVQEFIAASRKTRDLWFGSHMLSEVAREAAKELETHAWLIFPDLDSLTGGLPAPNKLLAILKERKVPETVVDEVRKKAEQTLARYWDSVLHEHRNYIEADLANEQIAHFLEFYAAWVPVAHDPGDPAATAAAYAAARTSVEQLLAGRKAVRDFERAPTSTARARSALDASRDSVVRPEATAVERGRMKLKGREELDAISLIKRTKGRDSDGNERFVSTARVAIDPFIRRLADAGDSRLGDLNTLAAGKRDHAIGAERFDVRGGLAHYASFPFDTQLFYDPKTSDEDVANQDKANRFFRLVNDAKRDLPGIVEIPSYFAVVQADGDRMGKLIGALGESTHHQRFSYHSSTFSGAVKTLAAQQQGALIYSGGDDVLAFLPLDRALAFAEAIRTAFNDTMIALRDDPKLNGAALPPLPTLSVGVAIGHYAEHLQRLLDWARSTEAEAKKHGRNALAVSFYPRGAGEASATAVHSWDLNPVGAIWTRWIDWHRKEVLSEGAGYELRDLAKRFEGIDRKIASEMLVKEMGRILLRKRGERGSRALTPEELRRLNERSVSSVEQLRRLSDELIISREIAKAIDTASGPLPATANRAMENGEEA